jgi:hypothetical protein
MKRLLVGLALFLSINGVFAANSAMEQSMRQGLISAQDRQSMSEPKVTQAFQGTGPLLLRDAIYLYNLPIYAGYLQALYSFGCDVFELVLDVENGYTDLLIAEGLLDGPGYVFEYPDRIYDNAAMFAYALYSGYVDKTFALADVYLYGAPGVNPTSIVGSATAFGYCFSTDPTAAIVYWDERSDQYYLSSEINPLW